MVTILDVNDNIPQLNSSQYGAVLREDTPVDSIIVGIAASDADMSFNGEIVFSLSSDFDSTFTISEHSGLIALSYPLDFEREHNYTFFVVATDNGDPPLSNSSEVTVIVTDLNDNPPLFASDTYTTSVPENAILGTSVFQIPATDADSTSNAELRFSVLSGNLASAFQLDERSGLISLQDHLDREVTAGYTLSLRVVDQGTPQFTAQAELLVQVADVNDHIPEFSSNVYHVSVPEQSGMGTLVGVVAATDADTGVNADLVYSIIAGDPDGIFSIDPLAGEVIISRGLDFESVPSHSLTVLVSDRGQPQSHSSTAVLSVSVLDDNEHPPSYPMSHYIVDVPDNTPPGARVGSFPTNDSDTYQRSSLRYSLGNHGNASFFSVDPYTGDLYTLSLLPSGGEELFISLVVSDGLFTVSVGVTVAVFPLSSSLPVFQPPSFIFSINEDTSLGEVVGSLTTTGDDVIFSLANESSVDFPFEVSSNGEINLIGRVDYETAPTWLFSVRAVSTLNSSLVSHAVVALEIDDANDNPPTFASGSYSLIISELTPVSSLLLTLTAHDLDPPGVNSEVEFSITGGNEGGKFDVDPLTGELIVAGLLDYEEQQRFVLNVSLVDENDHAPQFTAPHYQAAVSSGVGEGTPVLTLTAEDPDSGTNSDLSFFLTHLDLPLSFAVNHSTGVVSTGPGFRGDVDSYVLLAAVSDRGSPQPQSDTATIYIMVVPDNNFAPQFSSPGGYAVSIPETLPFGGLGDPGEIFIIDPSTGLISLVGGLDYNSVSLFQLGVDAEDGGTPPRNSFVTVNISVADVNNHAPLFPTSHYTISIYENTTAGSSIANITATDPDTVSISYLLSLNSFAGEIPLFSLDSETGVLSTNSSVDREVAGIRHLLVSAIDSGYPIRLSNSVPVTVIIVDLNDTPPQFDQSEYVFSLLRYLAPGVDFARVTATDSDLIGQPLEYDITGDTSGGIIGVNSTSGVMFARGRVPEEALGTYELTVLSPERFLCVRHYCRDPQLSLCLPSETCLPPNTACDGQCPPGTSLCPTTHLCHVTSLSESCDGTNVTCLIGQILAEGTDSTRECRSLSTLPQTALDCSNEQLYCTSTDECVNITSPPACPYCPTPLTLCPDTRECVPSPEHCCGSGGFFCDALNQCLALSEICQLPNVPPVVFTPLIHLPNPDPQSGDGHVISELLSNRDKQHGQ
ncbi:Protocadherin Fat 4 [Geodia barretti]|uniref:Protocadherin Fat 4 n=1 Tax=Geodia barretti TaxID=519541 RepID=A0AA35SDN3_GEOBA|nr:Protocadherin Fat 4 [Geodia barretti]